MPTKHNCSDTAENTTAPRPPPPRASAREHLARDDARAANTWATWCRFLERYTTGADSAERDALAVGIRWASEATDAPVDRWQSLLDTLPAHRAAIELLANPAHSTRSDSASPGPAGPSALSAASGSRFLPLSYRGMPGSPPAGWPWIPDRPLPVEQVAEALGLTPEELDALTSITAGLGLSMWTAPVDWAQPPRARHLGSPADLRHTAPSRVAAQMTAHWAPAGPRWTCAGAPQHARSVDPRSRRLHPMGGLHRPAVARRARSWPQTPTSTPARRAPSTPCPWPPACRPS